MPVFDSSVGVVALEDHRIHVRDGGRARELIELRAGGCARNAVVAEIRHIAELRHCGHPCARSHRIDAGSSNLGLAAVGQGIRIDGFRLATRHDRVGVQADAGKGGEFGKRAEAALVSSCCWAGEPPSSCRIPPQRAARVHLARIDAAQRRAPPIRGSTRPRRGSPPPSEPLLRARSTTRPVTLTDGWLKLLNVVMPSPPGMTVALLATVDQRKESGWSFTSAPLTVAGATAASGARTAATAVQYPRFLAGRQRLVFMGFLSVSH